MEAPKEMYIDGRWSPASSGATVEVIDPATEEPLGTVPSATPEDIARALEAAAAGFDRWRGVDAWTRSATLRRASDVLRARAKDIAALLTDEQGKPLAEAVAEVGAAADQLDWYADEARRIYGRVIEGHSREHRLMVLRQPIGPVAAFSPWNFPVLLSARKIAPALAAGCSLVVKPAIEAPRSALSLAEAFHDAGLPPGVLNMVTGDSGMISRALVGSPIIRKVTLTGSVPVGQEILRLAAEGIKAVTMELGGHSPVLVFEDADVEAAAETCARGKFRNNGQVCIAASRFLVQETVAERFVKRFTDVTRSLRVGDGRDEGTDVGPLANRRRVEATKALVDDALDQGAELLCGGASPEGFTKGFFFAPTVLTGVDGSMRVMREEPFCPVAPIATFQGLEDALEMANGTDFGLAAYLFTESTRRAFLAAEGLDVGMVGVNNLVIATAEAPFGGVKHSGFGREGGTEGIEAYTVAKYVNFRL